MRFRRILLVRGSITDMAVHDDQRRPVLGAQEAVIGSLEPLRVIGIGHAQDVPAIGQEPRRNILGERDIGMALDGHAVAVVNPTQIGQSQVAGQRGCLAGNPFHHVAIATKSIDVEVEQVVARPVVIGAEPLTSDSHADARRHALAERTRCRLDARRPTVLGMSRTAASGLAKRLDIVERYGVSADLFVARVHCLDACQMDQAVEQHRCVTAREDKAIAIDPSGIRRVIAQHTLPQGIRGRSRIHRRARMAGLRLLHSIHDQHSNGVDRKLVHIGLRSHLLAFAS